MTWANCTDVLQFRSGKMPWNRKSTVFLLTHKHLHIQINTKFSHIHPLSKYSHSSASQFILSDTHTVRPSSWGLLLPVHCWQTGSHHGAQAPQPSGCQDDDTSTSELRITLTSSSFLSLSSFQPSITSTPQLCITSYSLPPPPAFACSLHLFEPSWLSSLQPKSYFPQSLPVPAWFNATFNVLHRKLTPCSNATKFPVLTACCLHIFRCTSATAGNENEQNECLVA